MGIEFLIILEDEKKTKCTVVTLEENTESLFFKGLEVNYSLN